MVEVYRYVEPIVRKKNVGPIIRSIHLCASESLLKVEKPPPLRLVGTKRLSTIGKRQVKCGVLFTVRSGQGNLICRRGRRRSR